MKTLPLTNSPLQAVIDDDVYENLSRFKWFVNSRGYVERIDYDVRKRGRAISLHSHIITDCPKDMRRDHINGDRLDNRRINLRIVTMRQNSINCRPKRKRAQIHSRFKGVSWHTQGRKWVARMMSHGKVIHLGLFSDELDAAKTYNAAASAHFGEYARLNPV